MTPSRWLSIRTNLVLGLLMLGAATGAGAQGTGDGRVAPPPAAVPVSTQEIRIVYGERAYSIEAMILLDQYRIARRQILDTIDWEQSNVQRSRALQELALADYRHHVAAFERLYRELQAHVQRNQRGESSEFGVIKGLQQEVDARFEELELIAVAYAESMGSLTELATKVQEMKRRLGTWTFRVVRAEGVVSEGVTLAALAADTTPTLETMMAELSRLNGVDLNKSQEVVRAVAAFDEQIWAYFRVILHDYDSLGSRYRFFTPGAEVLKAEVDRGLNLMNFLRVRFGVIQGIPDGEGDLLGHTELGTNRLRTDTAIVDEMQDLRWRLGAAENTSGIWNGRGFRIKQWAYPRLIDQGERELALLTEGQEAPRASKDLPADLEDQVRSALTRQPPSDITRAFRGALLSILTYKRRVNLLSQRYSSGDLPSFEQLLKADRPN